MALKPPYAFDGAHILDADGTVASPSDAVLALNSYQTMLTALDRIAAESVGQNQGDHAHIVASNALAELGFKPKNA